MIDRKCVHCDQPIVLTTDRGWCHQSFSRRTRPPKQELYRLCGIPENNFDSVATPAPDR